MAISSLLMGRDRQEMECFCEHKGTGTENYLGPTSNPAAGIGDGKKSSL